MFVISITRRSIIRAENICLFSHVNLGRFLGRFHDSFVNPEAFKLSKPMKYTSLHLKLSQSDNKHGENKYPNTAYTTNPVPPLLW